MDRQSDAIRAVIVKLDDHEAKVERDVEALIGALVDLAAEVRR